MLSANLRSQKIRMKPILSINKRGETGGGCPASRVSLLSLTMDKLMPLSTRYNAASNGSHASPQHASQRLAPKIPPCLLPTSTR